MAESNIPGNVTDADVVATSRALVEILLNKLTAKDGRIHAEDAISGAAAVVAERCILAAAEFDPRRHRFTPGSRVFSDRVNGLISGNQPTVESAAADSVVGILRDQLVVAGYRREEFPDLKGVFEGFAARIGKEEDWGWVPLSTPADNRPHLMPLMVAFETRADVERGLAALRSDEAKALAASTLALADILGKVKDVIDHRVALLLAIETVNGMAKTAPMTDEAYQKIARDASGAASRAQSAPNGKRGWRRFLPWDRGAGSA
jgi:hypothetical protein